MTQIVEAGYLIALVIVSIGIMAFGGMVVVKLYKGQA